MPDRHGPSTFWVFGDEMDRGEWTWASLGAAVIWHRTLWGYEGGMVGTLTAEPLDQADTKAVAIVMFEPRAALREEG